MTSSKIRLRSVIVIIGFIIIFLAKNSGVETSNSRRKRTNSLSSFVSILDSANQKKIQENSEQSTSVESWLRTPNQEVSSQDRQMLRVKRLNRDGQRKQHSLNDTENPELDTYKNKNSNEISNISAVSSSITRLTKPKVVEDWYNINDQKFKESRKMPPCLDNAFSDKEMAQSLAHVIKTISVTHLHLVFYMGTDLCVLDRLWDEDIPAEVLEVSDWWLRISKLTYRSYTQHVLIGPVDWITATMEKITLFYANSSINAMNTRWIWVISEMPADLPSNTTATPSLTSSSKQIMDRVTSSLREGMKGVLLFRDVMKSIPFVDGLDSFRVKSQIKVAGIDAPGDGSWNLRIAGVWNSGVFMEIYPLWPKPSFDFRNRPLRISCIKKPLVFVNADGKGLEAAIGYLSEVMRIAQERLHFKDVILPTVGFGSLEPNGSWNGMVGFLQRKEADVAPLDFSPSYSRSLVIDFSIPVSEDMLVIVSKAPSILIKPFLILQIFSPWTWACIVGGAIFIEISVDLILRIEGGFRQTFEPNSTVNQSLGGILKAFVSQACERWPVADGARIAVISGLIVSIIIGSLYKGFITAFLAIPFRSTPIDSAADLIASGVTPAIRERTQFIQTLVLSEYGILHPVRDRMSYFAASFMSSGGFDHKVAAGIFALADTYSSAIGRAKSYEKRGERCQLYNGKVPLRTDMDVFAFSQNSPFIFAFDDTIRWLKFFGIIDYFRKQYFSVPCQAEVTSSGPEPMTVTQIQGSLYVLGIGLIFGTLVFVSEILWPKVFK